MQQRRVRQAAGFPRRGQGVADGRRADRQQVDRKQPVRLLELAGSGPDDSVDLLLVQVDRPGRYREFEVDPGIGLLKPPQPRNQPMHREGRIGVDVQPLVVAGPQHPVRRPRHPAKQAAEFGLVALASRGQGERPVPPHEKRQAERFLELPDVTADRRLGHVQLFGRLGKAEMAGGNFEGTD